ncbi:alpha/beta hydrolase [Microbacterium sp. M3]|uniref:Alpha/beta hydrolase n=1 Tax=Microbacterium arthrosphaerae TaxID=792652 RepID=A0ABU4GYH9_9MICO|nr:MULTISPECIES: alpha/beta hydrolase [Microbacterium]MDW4572126.1 alpha/beta hydrolase [Microbacterium arthrosphaerae]MDW7605981.1 alpha/beta hydrolase [Microbacterium sp. M3]
MSTLRLVAVSDLPTITLDADSASSTATDLSRRATAYAGHAETLELTWSGLPAAMDVPGVTEPVGVVVTKIAEAGSEVGDALDAIGSVLVAFAEATKELSRTVQNLRDDIDRFRQLVDGSADQHSYQAAIYGGSSEPFDWRDDPVLRGRNAELLAAAAQAERDWTALRTEASAALDAIVGGETDSLALPDVSGVTGAGFTSALGILAATGKTPAEWLSAGADDLARLLETTDPETLRRLLEAQPGIAERFWNAPPDSERVAAWWQSLPAVTQTALVAAIPTVIGNLGGVPYAARGQANLSQYERDMARYDSLNERQRASLDQITTALTADPVNRGTLIDYLIDAHGGMMPYAAVAYGDLDAADTTTWMAPGMETNTASALAGWGEAARNLQREQSLLDPTRSHAVVAWTGYVAPDAVGVTMPYAARDGADRFAAEIDATFATRSTGAAGVPEVAVVAHSYGTTMAANALLLTEHPISSYTMVGSAGIDLGRVTSLADLHVENGSASRGSLPAIFTTAATRDDLAPFGASISQRAEPNPDVAYDGEWVITGAQSFSSEGNAEAGLHPVDGHNPLGERGQTEPTGFLSAAPSEGRGYFDPGTQSLHNVAAASTGRISQIVDGLTPVETPGGGPMEVYAK